MELIPTHASYQPGHPVVVELSAPAGDEAVITISHLFTTIDSVALAPGQCHAELPVLPSGGYSVAYRNGDDAAETAVEIFGDVWRPRYGFVTRFDEAATVGGVVRWFRRLHLNAAQFYDWGYRHSELTPPSEIYRDPLGQPRDLGVVREMARCLSDAGVRPLGYSAVYAIANAEADAWQPAVLHRADRQPYRLGDDFLTLIDPAAPAWLQHYPAMLDRAMAATGLAGFHLDQYGWPKMARRGDGALVDVAASFRCLLQAVHDALPSAHLIFNNVNGFAAVELASAAQDATYIEVWPPHDSLADLGSLVKWGQALNPGRPVILAAYLSCFERETDARANAAARLVMATIFSHGGSQLLLGDDGRALVDPYYPHNFDATPHEGMFVQWYDFMVAWGDLLFAPEQQDVTEFMTDGINGDVSFDAPGVTFTSHAKPGEVWTRVIRVAGGWVIHLINLVAQSDIFWDAGKEPTKPVSHLRLHWQGVDEGGTVNWVSPGEPSCPGIAASGLDDHGATLFELPPLHEWALIFVPLG